jgi:TolB-like protein/DNA-binding winged helix-turn-helix (wHTH) protein
MSECQTERLGVGEWLVDPALDRVVRDGEVVKLEPRTMRLLLRLCASPGQVVSSQQLLDDVWPGVVVGPASVYQAISQLRRLLADTDPTPTYIATVPRKGYRLVAPVRHEPIIAAHDDLPAPALLPDDDGVTETAAVPPAPALQPLDWRWWTALSIAFVVIALAGALIVHMRSAADEMTPSIVVLPFVDMTADHGNEAFCDGLSEELAATLSQLNALRVVARTSAFAFRGRNIDVREIGRRLSATHVLEGSVRRAGDSIRVTAQLIDARRGYRDWSETYDISSANLLGVQRDIARSVAAALELRFPESKPGEVIVRADARDAQAYEFYLLARHYYRQRTPEANARAAELNARAIELDRRFAPAYVGLAQARFNEIALAGRPPYEVAPGIERLLDQALQLDDTLSDAYATRGALRRELNSLGAAKQDLSRAIALNRNNVQAIVNLGRVHEYEGEPQRALERFMQARLLDPLDFMRHVDRCVALQDLGRYADAGAACAEARSLQPASDWAFVVSGWLARAQGQTAQSLHWNGVAQRLAPANAELYLERADELLNLALVDEAKAALERASAAGDDWQSALRYADVLMVERGAAAVRIYLAGLEIDPHASALDLVVLTQASLSAGDDERARDFARRVIEAPDFATLVAASRASLKWGSSYHLPLALVDLRGGRREAGTARIRELLGTLDDLERNGYVGWGIHSLRADALALLGDADGSMQALRRAADHGWRSTWAAQCDPYLAILFERPDYQALIRDVERLNAAERERYVASAAAL